MKVQIKKFILDILFPKECLLCGKYGKWLCSSCEKKMIFPDTQVCPYCEKQVTEFGKTCRWCQKDFYRKKEKRPVDALLICAKYDKETIAKLIHFFKYKFIQELYSNFAKLMIDCLRKNDLALPELIIPIPLHKVRLRQRGFNQSFLLAQNLGKNLTPGMDIPVRDDLLEKRKNTSPQMKIKSYSERKKHLRGVFSVSNSKDVKGKTILLVDDVATTGATLFESALTLKEAGAKKVFAIVIARQEIKKS